MRWLVLASLLVHTPLTPLLALLGFFSWLSVPPDDLPDAPPINAIPIDILEEPEPGAPSQAEPAPPDPVPEPAVVPPPTDKAEPKVVPIRDAGLPDAPEEEAKDGAAPDAEPPDAEPPDAGPDAGARAEAEDASDAAADAEADAAAGPSRGDGGSEPVAAVSGDARRVIDTNANVRVLIYPEKIRGHRLAPRVGKLLGSIYQWRDFFGPAGIDPIRDVDRVLITGSELRNSKDVAAILKLNVSAERIHSAIDAIVRTDTEHGKWLEDAGLPAATAYADRAPRTFVIGSNGIVIVTPPSALADVLKNGKKIGLKAAKGPEVVSAYAVTPHRVRGLPVRIPESIRWVRIWVTPTPDGGALLEVTAEDESGELAAEHAEELESGLIAATTINLGALGQIFGVGPTRLVKSIELSAKGNQIQGRAVLTAGQLDEILGFAEAFLVDRRRPASRAPASPAGSGAPPASSVPPSGVRRPRGP